MAPVSKAYELFILVLTVLSLVVMVVMVLPIGDATLGMLQFYDNLMCLIFLIDFACGAAPPSRSGVLHQGTRAGSTCSARSRRSASPSATPACSGLPG